MKRKVALITGGSRGIGLGIAKALAKEGYDLAINGVRDKNQVSQTLKDLGDHSIEVIYCQGDIGVAADRESILQQSINHFGHLNVLVNNAGIAPQERKDLLEMNEESYDGVMNINLKGPFFLSQKVAQHMIKWKKQRQHYRASIINISSISATVASLNRGQYCMAKAGMSMMTKLFAARLGSHNIPVYEIRPGLIQTDMTAGVKEKYDQLIEKGLTIQPAWGVPADVGKAVSALVRGDMCYSTGQVIMVDGGLTIQRL